MPIEKSHHCPACGYDHRDLRSARCPECGAAVERNHDRIIPWERRSAIGYFKAFSLTLLTVTLNPAAFARAVQWPIDLRSARWFRWIIRALIILPCVGVFLLAWSRNDIPRLVLPTDGPGDSSNPAMPFWELRFLWAAGASMLPVLPIGFAMAVILATGLGHWFYRRSFEPTPRSRAMVISYYLIAPLGFVFLLCIPAVALVNPSAFMARQLPKFVQVCIRPALALAVIVILLAMLNQLRAVGPITRRGLFGTLGIGVGILIQAVAVGVISLGLLPLIAGLLRIIIGTMLR